MMIKLTSEEGQASSLSLGHHRRRSRDAGHEGVVEGGVRGNNDNGRLLSRRLFADDFDPMHCAREEHATHHQSCDILEYSGIEDTD